MRQELVHKWAVALSSGLAWNDRPRLERRRANIVGLLATQPPLRTQDDVKFRSAIMGLAALGSRLVRGPNLSLDEKRAMIRPLDTILRCNSDSLMARQGDTVLDTFWREFIRQTGRLDAGVLDELCSVLREAERAEPELEVGVEWAWLELKQLGHDVGAFTPTRARPGWELRA